jgi:hypothetical protein
MTLYLVLAHLDDDWLDVLKADDKQRVAPCCASMQLCPEKE